MNKIKNNGSGFSAVEIVMVVVIVGLIGAVGYLVYKNKHQPTKVVTVTKTVNSPTNSSQNSSLKNDQNLIKISELGVSLIVPASIKNITYNIDMGGTDTQGNHFYTAIFSDGIQQCSIASLSKINGQYSDYANVAIEPGSLVKQYGNYFIGYHHPQAICGSTSAETTQFSNDTAAFSKALTTISLIQ